LIKLSNSPLRPATATYATHALIGVSFESECNLHAVPRKDYFCKFIAKNMAANYKSCQYTLKFPDTMY